MGDGAQRQGEDQRVRASASSRAINLGLGMTLRPLGSVASRYPRALGVTRAALLVACYLSPRERTFHRSVDERLPGHRVRGEWVDSLPRVGDQVIYYLHGSAYVACSPSTHRGLIGELARCLDAPAFALRYRLAPRHRFPAANNDVLNGYRWLLSLGHQPTDIVVVGDSAGGHLALGLCSDLARHGIPQPGAVVAMSPIIDPTWELATQRETSVRDSFATVATARRITQHYLGGTDLSDDRLDVMAAVGPHLPPILIQCGGREVLAAAAERYADAVDRAGGHCDLEVWPGMFHVFQMSHAIVPEARSALTRIAAFARATRQISPDAASREGREVGRS